MDRINFYLNPAYLSGGRFGGSRVRNNTLSLLAYQQPVAVSDIVESESVTVVIRDYFVTLRSTPHSWSTFVREILPRYILLCKPLPFYYIDTLFLMHCTLVSRFLHGFSLNFTVIHWMAFISQSLDGGSGLPAPSRSEEAACS